LVARALIVILLADELFPDQLGVAPGVGLGLGGQGPIPDQVGFHLSESRLIRTRVNNEEEFALFHVLAFLKIHLDQLA
jgi:hypothetical protein